MASGGIFVRGAGVSIVGTVVRASKVVGDTPATGIALRRSPYTGASGDIDVSSSVVELAQGTAVLVAAGKGVVRASVIQDTLPVDGFGSGLTVISDPAVAVPSSVTVEGSVLRRNRVGGAFVSASTATIRTTVIEDSRAVTSLAGGLHALHGAKVAVADSMFRGNEGGGLFVVGAHAELEGVAVRGGLPVKGSFGTAILVLSDDPVSARGELSLRNSALDDNFDSGYRTARTRFRGVDRVGVPPLAGSSRRALGLQWSGVCLQRRTEARPRCRALEERTIAVSSNPPPDPN